MRRFIGLALVLSLSACATCKSTDSPEVCRTKQRDHSQPRALVPTINGPVSGTIPTSWNQFLG
jgi:hypothetical protein